MQRKKQDALNEPDIVPEVLDAAPVAKAHEASLARVEANIPQEMVARAQQAADACRSIVLKHCSEIRGRRHVQVEGWQAIANALGCVASASGVRREEEGYSAIGEVRRMVDGVVISTGEGFVGDDERMWNSRPVYARRAMAQTRAISRACRSAFAFIAVMVDDSISPTPDEEMPEHEVRAGREAAPEANQVATPPRPAQASNRGQGGAQSRKPTPASPPAPRMSPEHQAAMAMGDVNAPLRAFLGRGKEKEAEKVPEPPATPDLASWDAWLAQNVAAGMVEDLTGTHLRILLSNKLVQEAEKNIAKTNVLKAKDHQAAAVRMVERLQQIVQEREYVEQDRDLDAILPRPPATHSQARPVRKYPKMSGGSR